MFIILFSRATTALEVKMTTKIKIKHEYLENTMEGLQCYNCKAVPGLTEELRTRYSCVDRSHQLCEKCSKSDCECGSAVLKHPNLPISQLLKGLPVYCPNFKAGCRQMFLEIGNLDYHQQECEFRLVHCPVLSCQDEHGKIVFKDIGDHLKSTHTLPDISGEFKESLATKKCLIKVGAFEESEEFHYKWLAVKIELVNGVEFFLVGTIAGSIVLFWVYIYESVHEIKNYAYTLSITGENGIKSTFYDHVKPLDQGFDDIADKQAAFMVGTEVIKKSRDENGDLSIEVTIHSLKEKVEESEVKNEADYCTLS